MEKGGPGWAIVVTLPLVVAVGLILWLNLFRSNSAHDAKRDASRADLAALARLMETFRTDTGRYPTTDEGLDALYKLPPELEGWKGPYVTKVVDLDPWGSLYIYECAQDGTSFTITSYAADRKPGGEGRDADITSIGRVAPEE